MNAQFSKFIGFGAFFAACLFSPQACLASEIQVEPPQKADEAAFITIIGEIKSGDDEKFRKIAAEYSNAVVLLHSDGGMIGPAMDIGRTIKLRGYGTAVYKSSSCASACALIWLAGSKRVIVDGGEVGFHASYLDTDGKRLETGVGNALVGHYLSQLGFGEKTVVFATLAPPDKILWLNAETAEMSGIDFETIAADANAPEKHAAATSSAPPQIRKTPPAPERADIGKPTRYSQFMGDAKQTFRSPEDFSQALNQLGYQANVTYEIKNIPMIEVNVGGEDIAVGFSDCDDSGCNYIQIIDFFTDITEEEAYFAAGNRLRKEGYGHPYWNKEKSTFMLYNYFVIGSDGITVQTLVDNMKYFVRENLIIQNQIIERRSNQE